MLATIIMLLIGLCILLVLLQSCMAPWDYRSLGNSLLYTENLNLTPFSSSSPLGTKGSLGSLHAGENGKLFSDSLVLRPHPLQQKGLVTDVFASSADLLSCKQANHIINFGRCTYYMSYIQYCSQVASMQLRNHFHAYRRPFKGFGAGWEQDYSLEIATISYTSLD